MQKCFSSLLMMIALVPSNNLYLNKCSVLNIIRGGFEEPPLVASHKEDKITKPAITNKYRASESDLVESNACLDPYDPNTYKLTDGDAEETDDIESGGAVHSDDQKVKMYAQDDFFNESPDLVSWESHSAVVLLPGAVFRISLHNSSCRDNWELASRSCSLAIAIPRIPPGARERLEQWWESSFAGDDGGGIQGVAG